MRKSNHGSRSAKKPSTRDIINMNIAPITAIAFILSENFMHYLHQLEIDKYELRNIYTNSTLIMLDSVPDHKRCHLHALQSS